MHRAANRIRSRFLSAFNYANIAATLALFITLGGGTAYAAQQVITGTQIAKRTIRAKHIALNSVTTAHVKDGTLQVGDLSPKAREELVAAAVSGASSVAPAGGSVVGAQGEKGETGAQGLQGEKGETGAAGATGEKGETGETGAAGANGEKGETGAAGAKGEKGEKGEAGAQGPQGDKGEKGDKGETGAAGANGEKGETGAAGAQGEKGEAGAQGTQGEKGDKGETGAAGAKGEKGAKGDKGEKGDKGDKGETGAAGAQGPAGSVGFATFDATPPTAAKNVDVVASSALAAGTWAAMITVQPALAQTSSSTQPITCSLIVAQPDGSQAQTIAVAATYVPTGQLAATGVTLSATTNRAGAVLRVACGITGSSSSKISLGARTMAFKVG